MKDLTQNFKTEILQSLNNSSYFLLYITYYLLGVCGFVSGGLINIFGWIIVAFSCNYFILLYILYVRILN